MDTKYGKNLRRIRNKIQISKLIPTKQSQGTSLRKLLSQNGKDFCRLTSLHGLKYVASRQLSTTERGFFGLSLLAVIMFAAYFIFATYAKWDQKPVIVGINAKKYAITNEPFPAVTFCNLNQVLRSKAIQYSNNSNEHAMLQLLCKKEPNSTIANQITDWNGLGHFITNISQSCDKMIIDCRFGGKDINCKDFFLPILTDEGLCCVFNMVHPKFMYLNSKPFTMENVPETEYEPVNWYSEQGYPPNLPKLYSPLPVVGTGESLGLSITLDVQHNEYYCSSANGIGFKLALHSPNESPNVRETGVLIAPGQETKFRIRPEKSEAEQHLRSVKKKYRRCLFHSEGKLKYFTHYTQRNCEMECIAETLLKYCGCVSFYMPKIYRNASTCSIHKTQCVESVRLRTDPRISSCLDSCLPGCFGMNYFGDSFTTRISHDGFDIMNDIVENISHEYVVESIAIVNMYFRDNSFRSNIQTEFIGISDFLSGVGGLMGLFLGFSFISIAEMIYFAIIRPCRELFQYKNSPDKIPKDVDDDLGLGGGPDDDTNLQKRASFFIHGYPKNFFASNKKNNSIKASNNGSYGHDVEQGLTQMRKNIKLANGWI